MEYPTFAAIS
uniref:Uncharacterized protein n=1 Tax=Arundo donax TaxID=35708 RepID=A0A0A8Y3K6_ARUDO